MTNKTNVEKKTCTMKDCKRPYRAKGYCNVHYRKWRRGELEVKPRYRLCGEENCKKPTFKGGYCEPHFAAWLASKKGEAPKPAASVPAPAPAAPAPKPAAEAPKEDKTT